jgi:ParB family chromosome partitioning protein
MGAVTNTRDIPLNKLVLWEGNARKTGASAGIDELAASIAAHGLLNPLTIAHAPKGKYCVIAGQRRLLAMKQLAKAGLMGKADMVSCHMPDDDKDAGELSLAENVVRVAMHPADQFEAWRGLIDKGATVPEIASRFGAAESTVRKRLALARVSPVIFALYRGGEIDLETLQAFTVTDDHALQESVWQGLADWQRGNARAIRDALTEKDVPCGDRRVQFVGLDAYEAQGGAVRRDLFDPKGGGYVQDVALLDAMTREKLDAIAAEVAAEGWAWVEARPVFAWNDRQAFENIEPDEIELPPETQQEAERLQAEYDDLTDSDDEAAASRLAEIERRMDEIAAMRLVWPGEVKASAGAIVYLAHGGVAEVERGLVREEDAAAVQDDGQEDTDEGEAIAKAEAPALSASLVEDLTAQRTAALRIELARSPDVALAAVVHALAASAFYHAPHGALKLSLTTRSLRPSIREHETCPAMLALEAERERLGDILPGDHGDLWEWCLSASRETLLDVLAVAAAHGLDAVETKADANTGGRAQAQALAGALNLDMAQWYRPTAAGYFSRISKAAILEDLKDARGTVAPAWEKMKKGDLAVLAERETAANGWLPGLLR